MRRLFLGFVAVCGLALGKTGTASAHEPFGHYHRPAYSYYRPGHFHVGPGYSYYHSGSHFYPGRVYAAPSISFEYRSYSPYGVYSAPRYYGRPYCID
jgi:hypothetical protein